MGFIDFCIELLNFVRIIDNKNFSNIMVFRIGKYVLYSVKKLFIIFYISKLNIVLEKGKYIKIFYIIYICKFKDLIVYIYRDLKVCRRKRKFRDYLV